MCTDATIPWNESDATDFKTASMKEIVTVALYTITSIFNSHLHNSHASISHDPLHDHSHISYVYYLIERGLLDVI